MNFTFPRTLILLGSAMAFLFMALYRLDAQGAPATLSTSVSKQSVVAGERFEVEVRVRSSDQSINAVSGTISFPGALVRPVGFERSGSIVNFWTQEPATRGGTVVFEGIVLNPGYQGPGGLVFKATFEAKNNGTAAIRFIDGSVLANDGLGTNLLTAFRESSVTVASIALPELGGEGVALGRAPALPIITDYQATNPAKEGVWVKGKGEPQALTKLVFKDVAPKSIGERFIEMLQTKRQTLEPAFVENKPDGTFEYFSPKNLLAGTYNATPFLVDAQTDSERAGFGAQLVVKDSKVVRFLVVFLNVLALLVPVVALIVVIYFIPWYSWRRMRVLKRQLGLEEERLEISEHELKRQDKVADASVNLSPKKRL